MQLEETSYNVAVWILYFIPKGVALPFSTHIPC